MSLFTKPANDVFAPVDAAGNKRPVENQDAQRWGTEIQRIIDAAVAGGNLRIYTSRSALYADLAHTANTAAIVIGDSTVAYDGLYVKSGGSGSGSWTRVGDVPGQSFIKATNAGAGTADAILATTSTPINESALIALPIAVTNTGSPVTVAFNGGSALTIKTVSGNDVTVGGLKEGMIAAGYVSGSTFRLLNDQDVAALVAQAEAAADRAEDAAEALASAPQYAFASKAAAELFDPPDDPAFISIDGRYHLKVSSETDYGDQTPIATGARYRLKELSVTPEDFDVVAGVVSSGQRTANTIGFRKWLRYILETGRTGVAWAPYYEFDGPIFSTETTSWSTFQQPDNPDIKFKIDCLNGTVLKYFGAGTNTLFNVELEDMRTGIIRGLTVDGGDLAHAGIGLRPSGSDCEALILDHCGARNLRIQDSSGLTIAGSGLRIQADNAIRLQQAEVRSCTVENLTKAVRTAGDLPMQAIVVANADQFRIDDNYINRVEHDGTNLQDADGIVVFSGQDSWVYRRSQGSIDRNLVKNPEGRGFKLQANGNYKAVGNAVIVDEAIELIVSWSGFESQTGACHLEDSKLIMGSTWTGGAGARALYMQIPTATTSSLEKVLELKCNGLKVETDKELSRLWEIVVRAYDAEVLLELTDCYARGPGPVTSEAAGVCAAGNFGVITGVSGLSSTDRITVRTRDVDVHCRNNYSLASGTSGLSNWTDIVTIEAENHTCWPLTGSSRAFWSSASSAQTSSLRVRGFHAGTLSRIDGNLDWSKFLPGFDAYVGSGTMTNASTTFSRVSKQGSFMTAHNGTALRLSADNGATWTANIT